MIAKLPIIYNFTHLSKEKMNEEEDALSRKLKQRSATDSYRSLTVNSTELVDFSSNDYLGLSQNELLQNRILQTYQARTVRKNGATGSRLLTGTSQLILETESALARTFCSENGLIFSSGYMANLAFFSTIPQKGDTLLYDELSHACIKDGARLGMAKKFPFKHNDMDQLAAKLKRAEGQVYIVCESVYSMDGDFAPLTEMAELAKQYNARLIVDEAHSTGVFGHEGNGLVNQLGLTHEVYACIYTFGKAMGVHGAFIACPSIAREYLVNFSRPFIYTTAPSDFEVVAIAEALKTVAEQPKLAGNLHERIALFRQSCGPHLPLIDSKSAIQAVLIPGNEKVKAASAYLKQQGYDVRPILSPTVKAGEERLRICLHNYNSEKEIVGLTNSLNDYLSVN